MDFFSRPLERHSVYYFADGDLVILVEHVLFRVLQSTFTTCSQFKQTFGLTDWTSKGASDHTPLRLVGISLVDFERLLSVMYPQTRTVHGPRTVEEWSSILDLSTRWGFSEIRELAITELQSLDMSPVDKIALSCKFTISGPWTLAAYKALCERPQALTLAEAKQLGLETTIRIAQIREQLRARMRRASTRLAHQAVSRAADECGERSHCDADAALLAKHHRIRLSIRTSNLLRTGCKPSPEALSSTARLIVDTLSLDSAL